jgi:hypothetical protein
MTALEREALERKVAALIVEHAGVGYTLRPGGLIDPSTIFLTANGAAHVVVHAIVNEQIAGSNKCQGQ